MKSYVDNLENYWDKRFRKEKYIWGDQPSSTAEYAVDLFQERNVNRILVPGAGYGRNTKLFSKLGFEVVGIEISKEAYSFAQQYDSNTKFYRGNVLNLPFTEELYDSVYGFNILHLFRRAEREKFIEKCFENLKDDGIIFMVVFSDKETSYGKGKEVENNTFESKPGRPVHYFTEIDLIKHFRNFEIIETGIMQDTEKHGQKGEHTHLLRYIFAQKN